MITIIDYGVGNIKAFVNIYKKLNIPIKVAKKYTDLDYSTKIILPGVGSFDHAMLRLKDSGMFEKITNLATIQSIPVLGICVGMQMLARSSDEGVEEGLGWIDATVKKFDITKINFSTHLPHMGWNDVKTIKANPLLSGLEKDAKFYFLHSYYFSCNDLNDSIAIADYGIDFSCVVNHKNIYGIQCHPEKSHNSGILLLKNFAELSC